MTDAAPTIHAHAGEAGGGLERTLGPLMLWGLGVGYVISGMYFGWNLGLPVGGPYGMLVATVLVTAMYVTFVPAYAELACAMPRAGGAFVYATRAFGPRVGLLAGMAQTVEFVFAPPAIAAAIGAYFHLNFPAAHPMVVACCAYALFTAINIWGVRVSAVIELLVTVLAVGELLLFIGVVAPSFSLEAFSIDPLPTGPSGIFAAIPYAIWFYLAIEGIANVAEEARDPSRDLPRGFGFAMATLVVLALLTFFTAVGVSGWQAVVYPPGSTTPSDSPLPLAIAAVVGQHHLLYRVLVTVGLLGLVASFHGIVLAAGRSTFELGRAGFAPRILGRTLASRRTPAPALLVNMGFGLLALFTGRTGEIITLAVFGAVTLYVLSLLALFRLRRREPELARPFRTPLYPAGPGVSLVLAVTCLVALFVSSPRLGLLYLGVLAAGSSVAWWVRVAARRPCGEARQ